MIVSLRQSGNVFFYILVAIALLAALSIAVSRGSRTTEGLLSDQQAKIAAQELIDYSTTVAGAVSKLKLRGCTDNQINFAGYLTYMNAGAPSDESCNVFSTKGGNITPVNPSEQALDTTYSGNASYKTFIYTGNFRITNLGTSELDLLMYIPYINASVCAAINGILLGDNSIPTDNISGTTGFIGNYNAGATPDLGNEATAMASKSAFCVRIPPSGMYYYTQALIAR